MRRSPWLVIAASAVALVVVLVLAPFVALFTHWQEYRKKRYAK
jgi:hypothetical protein